MTEPRRTMENIRQLADMIGVIETAPVVAARKRTRLTHGAPPGKSRRMRSA